MKKILIIGFYGALIGIVIGIAVVCAMWLLSDNFKNFRPYSSEGYAKLNRLSRELYDQAINIDPYNIEATANKGYSIDSGRLGREAQIVYGHIKVDNSNRAIKFFNSINKISTKWDILFQLQNIIKHDTDQELQLAHKTIDFIQTVMPAGENEKRRDLLILLGNDYLEIENKEKAKIAFNEAAELHNKIRQDEDTSKIPETPESSQILISFGKIILFPLLFGAVGFILSVMLKPALEAFGRAIIAPAIAKKIGSNEMMKELNIKEN